MARQTFEEGQTVYVARYSRHNWHKVVVATPDIVKQNIHYVGICYVKDDGTVDTERPWDVLNNRQQIVTEEAHAEIAKAKDIGKLRQIIDTHRAFETDFAEYVEQASIIIEAVDGADDLDEIGKLAHYLRGMFSIRYEYSRLTHTEVRKVRADKRAGSGEGARGAEGGRRGVAGATGATIMEARTVTLRLVVRSRDFGKRRAILDRAVVIALAGAETALAHYGFRPTEMQAKVSRKRGEGQ